jgi:hypothetical protein
MWAGGPAMPSAEIFSRSAQFDHGRSLNNSHTDHPRPCVRQIRKKDMDKNDFKQTLIALVPGQCTAVPYEIFEDLFPPGVEDDGAKQSAYTPAARAPNAPPVGVPFGCR